jgi:hypothetical protein
MSFTTTLLPAILETVLARLALLFLAGADGDLTAARHVAIQSLDAYQVETVDELRLAGQVVSFGFHALEALSQAAIPDMPLNQILRLRGSAVSLSRECHRAEHRLEQLQQRRRDGLAAQPAEPPISDLASAKIDKAIGLIEATRQATTTSGANGAPIWSNAGHQREAARRITENLRKNQAAHLATMNANAPTAPTT